jgi:peptidoglycan-N-acetylglucosamine deacetylase
MARRLAAVSVDLDALHHYFAIHGLAPATGAADAAYDLALARMGAWAEARRIPLTLFAVGEDLAREGAAVILAVLARRGHAVENHSYSHRYDLTRLDRATMRREVEAGAEAIERVTGRRPLGFRAPGYTVNDALFDVLDEAAVSFDSSVFPCPAYYLAKAAAMGSMRAAGRVSRSVLDTPRVLTAPTIPYRPGARFCSRDGAPRRFVELPIQVTPGARLPFIGTLLGITGARGAAGLARSCVGEPLVNLELHAIDFLDATEGLLALAPYQPELRVPLAARLDALDAAVAALTSAGHTFVRLDEAARAFA